MLVYDEKLPRQFWTIAIVRGILPSRNYEIRRAIVRIPKSNTILKWPVKKLFTELQRAIQSSNAP